MNEGNDWNKIEPLGPVKGGQKIIEGADRREKVNERKLGIGLRKIACPDCGNSDPRYLISLFPNHFYWSSCLKCGFSWERTTKFITQLIKKIKDLGGTLDNLEYETKTHIT